jgi:AMP deaminase
LRTSSKVSFSPLEPFLSNQHGLHLDIFEPLFKATKDPSNHKKLHKFLKKVVGFDSVDDESKVEHRIGKTPPTPRTWNMERIPPYSYWYSFISSIFSYSIEFKV